jgi:hypothetical protein
MHAPHCILGVEADEVLAAVSGFVERARRSDGRHESGSTRRASGRT